MPESAIVSVPAPASPPYIAVVAGALGYRAIISAFIRTAWPEARIEEVDPFSQTMRGLGISFEGRCDVMVVAGIGTHAEAISALGRLGVGGEDASIPPIILLVSHELAANAKLLIAAGASAVLLKDSISRATLIAAIVHLTGRDDHISSAILPFLPTPEPVRFGEFRFAIEGEQVALGVEHFRPIATLAANPLSQVFLAEHLVNRKRAVVKFGTATPHHDKQLARRFCERYRFLFTLQGEAVVRYIDVGIAGSWPYVVLEYLGEGDLRRRLAGGITTLQALRLTRQIAATLRPLHAVGFAHMDLKPENIFFREDGTPVLIDFNISTAFGGVTKNRVTGDVLGSPFYLSPEQGRGQPVDNRSDLYSLGVMLFEMLTGERPFGGDNSVQVIFKHLHEEVPLLPKRLRALQPIIDGLLAKQPEERFADADALIHALDQLDAPFAPGATTSTPS